MKLRVAHIITQLELGGAQQNTLYTVGHLDPERYEPILICGPGGILDEDTKAGAWPTHFVKTLVRPIHPIKDVLALIAIYKLLRALKPHIVHTHSSKAGILGRMAAYLAGVPVIIHTFHGFGFTPGQKPWVRNFFIKVEKFCARMNTHLIFVSEDNRQEAALLNIGTGIPNSLIRSGIVFQRGTPGKVRHELGLEPGAFIVVSVGNFKPQKNPMDLARTAAQVLEKKPEIHFLFVGDGELRQEVETWSQDHGIHLQMRFLGWRHDIPDILADADSFLLTSLWEGLPRALVEASAAGLPCVAYGVNGVKDILKDNLTGFLIPPGDVAMAADKIIWIREHPMESRKLGEAASRQVAQEFDINRMVHEQDVLYQTLYEAVPLKNYYEPLWNTLPPS